MTAQLSSSQPAKRSIWRFLLPLLVQIALVLLIPAQAAYTYFWGESVILQTVPVDPYSLLQGYYVTLRYDVSQIGTLEDLPGWPALQDSRIEADRSFLEGTVPFYVVLEAPNSDGDAGNARPTPWTPVRVTSDRPANLPDTQVALKGRYSQGRIVYGVEQYFIPEAQRDEINSRIWDAQQSDDPQAYVVEVNVAPNGKAVPTTLWVEGVPYRF